MDSGCLFYVYVFSPGIPGLLLRQHEQLMSLKLWEIVMYCDVMCLTFHRLNDLVKESWGNFSLLKPKVEQN